MMFIIFTLDNTIGYIFNELHEVLDFMRNGTKYCRIEIWKNGKLLGKHF